MMLLERLRRPVLEELIFPLVVKWIVGGLRSAENETAL